MLFPRRFTPLIVLIGSMDSTALLGMRIVLSAAGYHMQTTGSSLYLAIIIHHTMLGPFYIVKLSGFDRPEEDKPSGEADKEHENDERDNRPEHGLSQP